MAVEHICASWATAEPVAKICLTVGLALCTHHSISYQISSTVTSPDSKKIENASVSWRYLSHWQTLKFCISNISCARDMKSLAWRVFGKDQQEKSSCTMVTVTSLNDTGVFQAGFETSMLKLALLKVPLRFGRYAKLYICIQFVARPPPTCSCSLEENKTKWQKSESARVTTAASSTLKTSRRKAKMKINVGVE